MFAAFGGPAARAAVGTKKLKKRKQKKDGDTEQEGEGEEKLATPYSIFDKNEMEVKMVTVLEQAMHLSVGEKLDLISALWESMAEHPERIPVPDWQLKELERRIEAQQKDPQPGQSWADVKREICNGTK